MHGVSTRQTGAAFAELICADDQWLRDEFDALIAANYRPPLPPPPAPPTHPPRPPHRCLGSGSSVALIPGTRAPARRHTPGQHERSPPPWF
jgi:hypothetical protein